MNSSRAFLLWPHASPLALSDRRDGFLVRRPPAARSALPRRLFQFPLANSARHMRASRNHVSVRRPPRSSSWSGPRHRFSLRRGLAHAIANSLAHLHLTLFLHALLERIHNVDDLRRRLALRLDGHLRRALFDLGAEIFMHGNRVLVGHRLGLKLS